MVSSQTKTHLSSYERTFVDVTFENKYHSPVPKNPIRSLNKNIMVVFFYTQYL